MLKIAVVGSGKQADAHTAVIAGIEGCELVGVCDKEELMAKQLYERYNAEFYFTDIAKMLEVTRPDIVHVTTPPHVHLDIGKQCFEAGCHVFFEKPFTLNTEQAEELIRIAEKKSLKITVGHNNQFTHNMMRMRETVNAGYLGGSPVHMESIWCYDLGDPRFALAFLGDKTHWLRSLPGQLAHNNISHGVCKISEFLKGDNPEVKAVGFTSPFLKSIGENDIKDEIRVIIKDEYSTTAYFTFSTQVQPRIQTFRIQGPKNSLIVDELHQTLIKVTPTNYKSYLNHFYPPLKYSWAYLSNSAHNVLNFFTQNLHFDSGRRYLIKSFYNAINEGAEVPIPYREILLTSRIMDKIFTQINAQQG